MRTIHILSGVPGSGKSTYVLQNAATGLIISRDAFRDTIRAELKSDKYFPLSQKEEWAEWTSYLNRFLANNEADLWIDQTTIGHGSFENLIKALNFASTDQVKVHVLAKPLKLCLNRNAAREDFRRVPDKVIEEMHKRSQLQPLTLENVRIICNHYGVKSSVKVVK